MKFSFKLLLWTMIVMALGFGFRGYYFVNYVFQTSMDREVNQAMDESSILRFAFETAALNVPAKYDVLQDTTVSQIASNLESGGRSSGRLLRICDEQKNVLYASTGFGGGDGLLDRTGQDTRTYRVIEQDGAYYIQTGTAVNALDRVLYLDPDILVINPVRALYDTDLEGDLMAAATHTGLLAGITDPVNRLRLENYEAEAYYNSGVLVMDLSAMRREVRPGDIFDYAREHADILLLPDQDVLNGLYGGQILGVDDSLWNYDARRFDRYLLLSQGERDMDWVMDHTAILHFCGKRKPWNHSYQGRFSALYKHYQRLVERR